MADAADRGRMTIYLGAAPGVGKTYAMLERAQALRRQGVDVIVGIGMTHGRSDTAALLDNLERLPERQVSDQGTASEFDLTGALRRRPTVLLLDELAHSNAPGSRHTKRWQDAAELLDAGIDVLTTVNIQHVESLREPVARLTGVDVRERVPDAVLDQAAAIELVDLPSEELLARVRAGKVYMGDGAERAMQGFFTPENLAGLRELALRYVAGRVQAQQTAGGLAASRQPAERLLVAVGSSPTSGNLIRAAKRMADATGASWLVVHAETPASLHLDAVSRGRIGEHLRLAESLGAEALTVGGDNPVTALIDAARRHGARRILVGKPAHGRLRDLWRESLVHDLIRSSGDLEVLAITGNLAQATHRSSLESTVSHGNPSSWWSWAIALVAVGVAIGVAVPLRGHLEPANLTLPFLLAVVGVALLGQRGPVLVATVVGVGCYDFLCIPPYGSFAVSDAEYLLTFAGMVVVGMTIAHLVARLRRQADQAFAEAEGAVALHRLGGGLAATRGLERLVETSAMLTSDILGCQAAIMVTDAPGSASLSQAAMLHLVDGGVGMSEMAVAQWVARHGQPAGRGTDTLPAAAGLHLPLVAGTSTVGVLVLTNIDLTRSHDPTWIRLAEASARIIALSVDCERLNIAANEERGRADNERLRATLLAGVSHDLRTPLTAISGLAMHLADDPDPERRRTAQTIAEQADRLATTVRNLLDLTKIGSGAVRPRRVLLAAEDAIATAVAAVRNRIGSRLITVDAGACPPILADETLLHSALVNLLDNALIHGAGPILITATAASDPTQVDITVSDQGPGVPHEDWKRIFDAWQRGRGAAPGGAGLGLALAKAIMNAHGGRIMVNDRAGGGAAFTCTLQRHADT